MAASFLVAVTCTIKLYVRVVAVTSDLAGIFSLKSSCLSATRKALKIKRRQGRNTDVKCRSRHYYRQWELADQSFWPQNNLVWPPPASIVLWLILIRSDFLFPGARRLWDIIQVFTPRPYARLCDDPASGSSWQPDTLQIHRWKSGRSSSSRYEVCHSTKGLRYCSVLSSCWLFLTALIQD